MLVFYDIGKVAMERGDLSLNHMPHSFGIGLTLRAGGVTQLKVYFAWAGHEGTHTTFAGNSNNFKAENDLHGVF